MADADAMQEMYMMSINVHDNPGGAIGRPDPFGRAPSGTAAPAGPRLQRFAYYVPGRENRPLMPHQLRDADAAMFVLPELLRRGFQYSGLILNYPARCSPPVGFEPSDEWLIDNAREDDLWLISTRIPVDDAREASRSRVERSESMVEKCIVTQVRRHLPYVSRTRIEVADRHLIEQPEVAMFRNVLFQQNRCATIQAYLPSDGRKWMPPLPGRPRSLAYLIHDRVWPGGPRFFAAFGLSGAQTLMWHWLLATRFPHLIASVDFAMAELIAPPSIPARPLTLDFAADWEVRMLTRHP